MKKYFILQVVINVIGVIFLFLLPKYLPYFVAILAANLVLVFGEFIKQGKKHHKELAFSILSMVVFLVAVDFSVNG